MAENFFKSFKNEVKKEIVRDAADGIELAHHDPNALKVIDDRAKELILKILNKIKGLKPIALEEAADIPESPSHQKFQKTWGSDSAAIHATFVGMEESSELPKNFYVPIRGGHEYLEHILDCEFCSRSLLGSDPSVNDEAMEMINQELNQRGFKKKEEQKGGTFKNDIDFPKEH